MVESRWLRWVGPGLVALGAMGLVASTAVGAGPRAWTPRSCLGQPSDRVSAARDAAPDGPADLSAAPWYRLDPVVGNDGALHGQRLVVGRFGDPITRSLDLPGESFAAGPFGRAVLVGADDGTTSRLMAVDIASGCSWTLATETDVIRRATIDRAGMTVFEMRVDRTSRADLGIWRRRIDVDAPAVRVLAPIAPDVRFGRTFSTEFTWDLLGDRLAVQSCGEVACRTRLIDQRDRLVASLASPDLGLLVGVDGDRVVTYESCRGLPCPIVSTDMVTGERHVLTEAAGFATLTRGPDGARLIHETRPVMGAGLRSISLDGGRPTDLAPTGAGTRLTTPLFGGSATRLPSGWILIAPDGRLPIDKGDRGLQLRHLPDGAAVQLDEVLR